MSNVYFSLKQVNNLNKLADYLLKMRRKTVFDMRRFTQWNDDVKANKKTDCGTSGCAIGYGSYAGIPKKEDEDWFSYSYRQFIPDNKENNDCWEWCFSHYWYNSDNSPKGAARRIKYMLKYGLPENWREQMLGDEPISY